MTLPLRAWLLATPGLGALLVVACMSPDPGPRGPLPPAGSAERAEARDQRAARKAALDEQAPRAKKAKSKPPPPPAPAPSATASASASAATDAGAPQDAAVAASDAAPADAAPDAAPPDPKAICGQLCDRALMCARELVPAAPPGMDESIVESMLEKMREQCMSDCLEKAETADETKAAEAKACLAIDDCEDFMECMRNLDDA